MTTPRGPISAEQAHAEATSLLRELIAVVKGVTAEVRGLRDDIAKRPAKAASAAGAPAGPTPAAQISERDIAEFAAKSIKKMPPRWKEEDFTGFHHDETTPEFLECLAGFYDFKADKPMAGKEQWAKYDRRDAACARALAARLRAQPPAQAPSHINGAAPAPAQDFEL